ncbi:porin [Paraglaciecola chathamensis]|uniref:porin n=1 Tax=Paraglaciecola chathamensis TaxID=368405 RepID=UPI002703DCF7|nr:porin [Paraglaciecola chathamensis]MDO6559898.1 porin [Paraglaciecola chathamensis]
MTFFPKPIFAICLLLGSYTCFASAQAEDNLQFSGFARVVMGYLDDSNAEYLGYDNSISLEQETLIGLQADYQLSDSFSITGQLIGHSGEQRDSGIEWLYLTYTPTNSLRLKLGRQRTPFLNYSDVIDVGYSYPWATLPQQTYPRHFFSTFDGLTASYEIPNKLFVLNIEGYWGYFEDKVVVAEREMNANTTAFHGVISNIIYKNWTLRASYHQGNTSVELDELTQFSDLLNQIGFRESAESLATQGLTEVVQLSVNYENLDYFVRAEVNRIQADIVFVPNTDGYFISTGYNFHPFTSYISYAKNTTEYDQPANDIPVGLSPQLDGLAFSYLDIFNQLPIDSSEAFTIGTRWDIQPSLALKAEANLIKGSSTDTAFFAFNNPDFDREAVLYLLALEWVF